MPVSHFDQLFHTFRCQNTKCRELFNVVLRRLLEMDKVVCPKCGHPINIRESKKRGAIRKDFDTAQNLDIKAGQKK